MTLVLDLYNIKDMMDPTHFIGIFWKKLFSKFQKISIVVIEHPGNISLVRFSARYCVTWMSPHNVLQEGRGCFGLGMVCRGSSRVSGVEFENSYDYLE